MEVNRSLDRVIRKTLAAMEDGQETIFGIAEAARNELERLQPVACASGVRLSGRGAQTAVQEAPAECLKAPLQQDKLQRKRERLVQTLKQSNMLLTRLGVAWQCLKGYVPDYVLEDEDLPEGKRCGQLYVQMLDNERSRIAREIHDGPAQALANLLLKTVFCEQVLAEERPGIQEELLGLKETIRGSLQDIRKILFDLRPKELDQGLVDGLRQLIQDYQEQYGLSIKFTCSGQEKRLQRALSCTLFRIVQEALSNVWKHSCCDQARVRLEMKEHRVTVEIYDDGRGFDLKDAVQSNGCFGLIGMQERARLLDGMVLINTAPGQGTQIDVTIPIEKEEDELG